MAHVLFSWCIGNFSLQWQLLFVGSFYTFLFRAPGTGIWFFGAKRPQYGSYSVSIDGRSVSGNARSQHPLFQQLLGGRSGLSNGPHQAVFTNTGSGSFIDLDSIVFETQTGSLEYVSYSRYV